MKEESERIKEGRISRRLKKEESEKIKEGRISRRLKKEGIIED